MLIYQKILCQLDESNKIIERNNCCIVKESLLLIYFCALLISIIIKCYQLYINLMKHFKFYLDQYCGRFLFNHILIYLLNKGSLDPLHALKVVCKMQIRKYMHKKRINVSKWDNQHGSNLRKSFWLTSVLKNVASFFLFFKNSTNFIQTHKAKIHGT